MTAPSDPDRRTDVPIATKTLAILCFGLLCWSPTCAKEEQAQPNILIILADDLGYSDLGCYGGEIRTPALDQLAANGLRYTRFYNSSRCCPSRASLMTGLYPHQAGIGRFVGKGKLPGYRGHLTERCVTLAEVLKPAGYSTYTSGKWHLNDPGPIERGFDEFYGFPHGYGIDSWDPKMMIRLPEGREKREYKEGEFFATDAITDHALDFLTLARKKKQPWLLYTAYQAPHFPVQAPPELSATYDGIYAEGWDLLRTQRFERMKKMGLIDKNLKLPPRSPIDHIKVAQRIGSMTEDGMNPPWSSLPADRRADLARRMAVFAAMVENMDRNIGRLIKSLEQNGELDNTLILFLSDNGACAEWEPFGFDLDAKDYLKNKPGHGINGYTPGRPNVLHKGDKLATMGGPGSLFSYGCSWANLSNTPLWLYKHYAHEGGVRTPMIAHWPKRIRARGELRHQVSHVMDIMATCVEIAEANYPKQFNGHDILAMEGRSLTGSFDDKSQAPRRLVLEHERNAALIEGDWKLVGQKVIAKHELNPSAKWELYHLGKDPTEQHDLSQKEADRVKRMVNMLEAEAKRTLVLPAN